MKLRKHVKTTLLAFQVFLVGHIVPYSKDLLRWDLMYSQHFSVAAQTVRHLKVVKSGVLEEMNAQFAQTQSHVHVFQVQESRMERGLVHQLGHVSGEHISGAWTERRVSTVRVELSGHKPLVAGIPYGSSVYYATREKAAPRLGIRPEKVEHQIVHIDEYVAVGFHDVASVGAVRGHPAHAHEGLQGQIVVGIHKVLHQDVVEDLTLLFHHLVEDRLRVEAQEEQRQNANVSERVLVSPRLADGLPGVELLVVGADEEDEEGRRALAFLGLVDEELEIVRIEGTRADVAERIVLRGPGRRLVHREGHLTHVGGRGPRAAEIPQSAGPAHHGQHVKTRHLRWHLG